MVRQAPVICVMAPPIHLGAWSMALYVLWLPFELLVNFERFVRKCFVSGRGGTRIFCERMQRFSESITCGSSPVQLAPPSTHTHTDFIRMYYL